MTPSDPFRTVTKKLISDELESIVIKSSVFNCVALLAISAFGLVSCASTPPSIRTNERPAILDHPSVLAIADHDPESTDLMFLDAVQSNDTFGYCLPMGPPKGDARPVLCLITELGNVYAIVDHLAKDGAISQYEIGPGIRKTETTFFFPLLDAEIVFERE